MFIEILIFCVSLFILTLPLTSVPLIKKLKPIKIKIFN